MKRLWSARAWIGVAIGGACLVLAFWRTPFREVGERLAGVNGAWIAVAVLVQLVSIGFRAWRWTVLLRLRGHLADAFWAQCIGYLVTNILPLRLGEPARVVAMARRCRLPLVQVAATAAVERVLDVATMVLVLLLVLPVVAVPTAVVRAGLLFGAAVAAALVATVVAVRYQAFTERLLAGLGRRLPRLPEAGLRARYRELVAGLAPLLHLGSGGAAIGLSLATWATSIATAWFAARAFQPAATATEVAFMMVALAFAVAVPASPGFIGVFQYVGQQALTLPFPQRYPPPVALAIVLALHLAYYVPTTLLGVAGLWRFGLSLGGLSRTVREPGSAACAGKESTPCDAS